MSDRLGSLRCVLMLSSVSCGLDNRDFTYNVEFPFVEGSIDTFVEVYPDLLIAEVENTQDEGRDVIGSAWINKITLESLEGGSFDFLSSITVYLNTGRDNILLAWASNLEDRLGQINFVIEDVDLADHLYARNSLVTVTFYGIPDRTFQARLSTEVEVDIDVTAAACSVVRW